MTAAPLNGKDADELGFDPARLARLAGVASRYVDEGKTAGVVMAVARDGEVAYHEAFGCQDLSTRKAMDPDTLFRIYSMTKPITTAAAMMLIEETRLRLTDQVADFFPALGDLSVYVSGDAAPFQTESIQRPVTVVDLLTHTSGLGYGIGDEHPLEQHFGQLVWGVVQQADDLTWRELVDVIAGIPLVHQPGTHWRYSIAIDVLGAIIEEVSGESLGRFLADRIFDPLGMDDTFFTVPEGKRGRLATVYQYSEGEDLTPGEGPPVMAYHRQNHHPNGGGGLVSTAADFLRFGQMLLDGGTGRDADGAPGERILGDRTVALMMSNHVPVDLPGWDQPGWGFGFGGRVAVDPSRLTGYASIGRYDWGGAASTAFLIDPAEGLQTVVMQQVIPGFATRLCEDLETTVYQALVE